jgi:outer membrane protein TolC
VRQAERRLAAATAGIGIATGRAVPDISIGATIGTVGIFPISAIHRPTAGASARR